MTEKKYPTQQSILDDYVDCSIFDHRIIVAGSRGYSNYDEFATELKEIIAGVTGNIIFYSGMAKSGADKLIIEFCEKEGYLYYPYPADWDRFGKGAGYIRNNQMADTATWLIAFHDGVSPGTQHMINAAKDKELRINVVNINVRTRKVKLYTIQMGQWRYAKALGIRLVDITAKSGIEAFAPEMENVLAYKAGTLSEVEYTRLYKNKMFTSTTRNEKYWKHLLKYDEMAFACYCPAGSFCHRHIFIELVKEYLEKNEIEVVLCGEITKESVDEQIQLVVDTVGDK